MPITVHKLSFTKADLTGLSAVEQKLFVIAGHVSNDIGVLQKLLVWSMNSSPVSNIAKDGTSTQNLIIVKLLAGKLNEAWRVMQRVYFGGPSQSYYTQLPEDAQAAQKTLRSYFGKTNAITEVRNNFAFHYSEDEIPDVLADLPDEMDFRFFLGEKVGNSLYHYAEEPMFRQLIDNMPSGEGVEAFNALVDDVLAIAPAVLTFFVGCILVASQKMYPGRALTPELIGDEDLASLNDMEIPFFMTR